MRRILLITAFLILSVLPRSSSAEQFRYASHRKRDPFIPLVGQENRAGIIKLSEVASIDDIYLEGIAGETTGKRMAILNGELVKEGYKSGEVEMIKITKTSVTLTINGKQFTVKLPEERGKK